MKCFAVLTLLVVCQATNLRVRTRSQALLLEKAWNAEECPDCPNEYYLDPGLKSGCKDMATFTCHLCATCIHGQTYVATPCKKKDNTECLACSKCVAGTTFKSSPCSVSNNTVCSGCAVCQTGFFEQSLCTVDSDTVCTACPQGKYADNIGTKDNCTDHSVCPAGQFASSPGTAHADVKCTECADGKYTSTPVAGATTQQATSATTYEKHTGKHCVGTPGVADVLRDFVGTADECKLKCTEMKCIGFVRVNSGTYGGKCYFRGGTLQAPVANIYGDSRDCYIPQVPINQVPNQPVFLEIEASVRSNAAYCDDWTTPVQGFQYIASPGSKTADHVIQDCATCVLGTSFQTTACTSNTNRVCTSCTPKPADKYRTTDCSLTADAAYADCGSCSTGKYESASCTDTQNAECTQCTQCVPSEYVSHTCGTNKTDAECTSCVLGKYSTGDNAVSCSQHTVCTPGNYISTKGSPTSDVQCSPCANQTFSTIDGATECTPFATRTADSYIKTEGSPTSARIVEACATCGPEQFIKSACSERANRVCDVCVTCKAGEFEKSGCVNGANRVCEACATGSFSKAGATQCTTHSDCPAGSYVKTAGTNNTDHVCDTCAQGFFTDKANKLSECQKHAEPAQDNGNYNEYISADGDTTKDNTITTCTVCQGPGAEFQTTDCGRKTNRVCATCGTCSGELYQTAPCGKTSNITCAPCAKCTLGTSYETGSCSAQSNRVCTPCTTCASGKFVKDPATLTSNRVCESCGKDTFSNASNAAKCTPHTTCVNGEFMSVDGTPTSNSVCATCAPGFYIAPTQVQQVAVQQVAAEATTQYLKHTGKQCAGTAADVLRDFVGTADECKLKCTEMKCNGFVRVNSGSYGGKCYFRGGTLQAPVANIYGDDRDCYVPQAKPAFLEVESSVELTQCTKHTQPSANTEYITTPGTTSSDNVIAACTVCESFKQYWTTDCSATTNRVCTACTLCPTGKYQTAKCADNFDVLCEDVVHTECDFNTTYKVSDPTTKSGYECMPLQICSPDEYESVAKTDTSDRVCAQKVQCSSIEYETGTNAQGSICHLCSLCPAGLQKTGGCTGTQDTTCAAPAL